MEEALTVSGGATPSATTGAINIGGSTGSMSVILENEGTSDSLTVTYQIGVISDDDLNSDGKIDWRDIIWMTPTDGGALTALTTVDVAGSYAHESVNLAVSKYYRFIVANNSATKTATVNLYLQYQMAE